MSMTIIKYSIFPWIHIYAVWASNILTLSLSLSISCVCLFAHELTLPFAVAYKSLLLYTLHHSSGKFVKITCLNQRHNTQNNKIYDVGNNIKIGSVFALTLLSAFAYERNNKRGTHKQCFISNTPRANRERRVSLRAEIQRKNERKWVTKSAGFILQIRKRERRPSASNFESVCTAIAANEVSFMMHPTEKPMSS